MKRAEQVDQVTGSLSLSMAVIDAGLALVGEEPVVKEFKSKAEELQAATSIGAPSCVLVLHCRKGLKSGRPYKACSAHSVGMEEIPPTFLISIILDLYCSSENSYFNWEMWI